MAVFVALLVLCFGINAQANPARPNVLWITCEDMSPNLGCYGDAYAVTPRIDRFASEAVRYTAAFAPIGVCAPSRSCLITGMWPPSIGTHHMRCQATLPQSVHCFPYYLRQGGYYCTNNVKTDYNFAPPEGTWDVSSRQAHWRGRAAGQPFFSVFNLTTTHEGQVRLPDEQFARRTANLPREARHDPALAPLPPYHPDVREVRRDWARYADLISVLDGEVGAILDELERDGLADETIVFFFSDHGAGLPRSKRWLYDTSTRVPLLIRFPKRYENLAPSAPRTTCDRLVSFVDFGATVLSLAGVPIPSTMQGVPFLGAEAGAEREYVYGFRDRMDERYDMLRSVRDERYKLIRNYQPELPYFGAQHVSYMYEMPTMRAWQRLADEGQLTGAAAQWMSRTKPEVELYDTVADPWEIHNLADDPQYSEVRQRLHAELARWMREIGDLGFLPECDLRTRFGAESPYDAVRRAPRSYPFDRVFAAAELAASTRAASAEERSKLLELVDDDDAAIRYWAVQGLVNRGGAATNVDAKRHAALVGALADTAPAVRIAAAEALAAEDGDEQGLPVLVAALQSEDEWARLLAANSLDRLDERAASAREAIAERSRTDSNEYVRRVTSHIVESHD